MNRERRSNWLDEDLPPLRRIRVYPGTAGKDGDCNFCDRNIGQWGLANPNHPVAVMNGNGLLARMCRDCVREFLGSVRGFPALKP